MPGRCQNSPVRKASDYSGRNDKSDCSSRVDLSQLRSLSGLVRNLGAKFGRKVFAATTESAQSLHFTRQGLST